VSEAGPRRVAIGRLMGYLGISEADLADRAGCRQADVESFLGGGVIQDDVIARMAEVLDMDLADFYAASEMAIPGCLTPVDAAASDSVAALAQLAMKASADDVRRMRVMAGGLSSPDCSQDDRPPEEVRYRGDGAIVIRMLQNRNLSFGGMAYAVLPMSGLYLSPSTYAMIRAGRRPIKPVELNVFAVTLGIPPGKLAALVGLELADVMHPATELQQEVARLMVDVRRLDKAQIRSIIQEGER